MKKVVLCLSLLSMMITSCKKEVEKTQPGAAQAIAMTSLAKLPSVESGMLSFANIAELNTYAAYLDELAKTPIERDDETIDDPDEILDLHEMQLTGFSSARKNINAQYLVAQGDGFPEDDDVANLSFTKDRTQLSIYNASYEVKVGNDYYIAGFGEDGMVKLSSSTALTDVRGIIANSSSEDRLGDILSYLDANPGRGTFNPGYQIMSVEEGGTFGSHTVGGVLIQNFDDPCNIKKVVIKNVHCNLSRDAKYYIDWGDGSNTGFIYPNSIWPGQGSLHNVRIKEVHHEYANPGNYTITITGYPDRLQTAHSVRTLYATLDLPCVSTEKKTQDSWSGVVNSWQSKATLEVKNNWLFHRVIAVTEAYKHKNNKKSKEKTFCFAGTYGELKNASCNVFENMFTEGAKQNGKDVDATNAVGNEFFYTHLTSFHRIKYGNGSNDNIDQSLELKACE